MTNIQAELPSSIFEILLLKKFCEIPGVNMTDQDSYLLAWFESLFKSFSVIWKQKNNPGQKKTY